MKKISEFRYKGHQVEIYKERKRYLALKDAKLFTISLESAEHLGIKVKDLIDAQE